MYYDELKSKTLVDRFTHGFNLQYQGPRDQQRFAPNLKLHIGDEVDLWNKVMKEVQVGRYAGPFCDPPFEHFVQSPIGLVSKDGGRNTRLIFHLSYPKNGNTSINYNTPKNMCRVTYPDFIQAITRCLEEGKSCHLSKSDMSSAFRVLGVRRKDWSLLIMKAVNPLTQKLCYFIDKCLPFGAAISCALFQAVSDAIAHIVKFLTKKLPVNYLDDYLFVALLKAACDRQLQVFLDVCKQINFPVSIEKNFLGNNRTSLPQILNQFCKADYCGATGKFD